MATRYQVEWHDGEDVICQGFAFQSNAIAWWQRLVVSEGLGEGPWGATLVFLGPDGARVPWDDVVSPATDDVSSTLSP